MIHFDLPNSLEHRRVFVRVVGSIRPRKVHQRFDRSGGNDTLAVDRHQAVQLVTFAFHLRVTPHEHNERDGVTVVDDTRQIGLQSLENERRLVVEGREGPQSVRYVEAVAIHEALANTGNGHHELF